MDLHGHWMNPEFHDATLILSSDRLLLEQSRLAAHARLNGSSNSSKKRRTDSFVEVAACANDNSRRSMRNPSHVHAPTPATVLVLTIPAHRIILSTGSEYFRTAIATVLGDSTHSADRQGAACGCTQSCHPVIAVLEEDVAAAQGVLKFLYSKKLDSTSKSAPKLMRMLMVADRWAVPGCVTACCKAIAALSLRSLTLGDALSVLSPEQGPIPPGLHDVLEFSSAWQQAGAKLLEIFGDVPSVMASPTLTAQLLQLPHIAMLVLLRSNALTTDSEDSVLTLLSWWLGGEVGSSCLKEPLQELKSEIRYSCLSSTYLAQAWPLVPSLKPNARELVELHEYRSFIHQGQPWYARAYSEDAESRHCPQSWFQPRRRCPRKEKSSSVHFTLDIPTEQLTEHLSCVRAMKGGGTAPPPLSVSVDSGGLSIELRFLSRKSGGQAAAGTSASAEPEDCLAVYLGVYARLPKCSSKNALQHGVPGRFSISISSNVRGKHLYTMSKEASFNRGGEGWDNFAQAASNRAGNPLLLSWWAPFLVDGHVRLTVEFTDEREPQEVRDPIGDDTHHRNIGRHAYDDDLWSDESYGWSV